MVFKDLLLGVRAVQEEFSLTSTGFMMSGYFVGYFIGAATIPNIISRVGHIRVFAAFASLASLIILVHSILINPFIWFLLKSTYWNKYGLYLYSCRKLVK